MSGRSTVAGDDALRLFLALEIPDDAAAEIASWGRAHLDRGRIPESFHVTLAFLGRRLRAELPDILGLMRREAAATEPFALEPVRYRETRSVGMLVLSDPSGRATALAARLQAGLEELGVYERERRPWLPHLTVLRFREQPRLRPPLPATRTFVPSEVAALLSRLHPSGARYEVVESCAIGRRRRG